MRRAAGEWTLGKSSINSKVLGATFFSFFLDTDTEPSSFLRGTERERGGEGGGRGGEGDRGTEPFSSHFLAVYFVRSDRGRNRTFLLSFSCCLFWPSASRAAPVYGARLVEAKAVSDKNAKR